MKAKIENKFHQLKVQAKNYDITISELLAMLILRLPFLIVMTVILIVYRILHTLCVEIKEDIRDLKLQIRRRKK